MGRGRNRKGKTDEESILTEASRIKQQAERKPDGPERIPLLEKCAQLFQNALNSGLSIRDREEALFDLGEVFLLWSSAVKKATYWGNDSAFKGSIKKYDAIQMQHEASIHAASFCRKSVETYKMVYAIEGGEVKQESLVNCANALCGWGDLVCDIPNDKGGGITLAASLYAEADNMYSGALTLDPEDVELLTNFGDCCIKRAELAYVLLNSTTMEVNQSWTSATQFYEQAFRAYAHACSRADVKVGDDLAGLLQNWGAGLLSFAEHTVDIAVAAKAFKDAEEKMKNAANFSRLDISIYIALGELFSVQADRFSQDTDYQPQVLNLLEKASNEGYGIALEIDATNLDALIGLGEVCSASRKHFLQLGDTQKAEEHSVKSLHWYLRALNLLEASVNKYELNFEEQYDLMYNMACAAEICGKEGAASQTFKHLLQVEAISPAEIAENPELQSLRDRDWFVSLMKQKS
ncbi:uncharacterized protein LOC131065578 isoform X1 [Cryptomeria japonica]|uniref:uncharacterized protein LOC131065578 isoform X1 n=1 Tax=Cryptomeria japonica TaxID=3369 RepID=UPI0027DAA260|nr:uncharacterized protein LOC131065578 isoform X1 [Cryptomeria japonica]